MNLNTFKLEEYLGRYEFTAPYLLCCSDAQTVAMQDVLAVADNKEQALWNNLTLGYTEVPGMPALRETIAKQLYPGLAGEHILCFAGAEEGIFCALSTLCQPEDHVIVLTPCYQSLLEIPRSHGCSVTTIELQEENAWRIDVAAIAAAIKPNTKWLVMNFPHNPTGQVITPEELTALVALLDKHGIYLFADEVYRLLGPEVKTWAAPAAVAYRRALSLGVMSKAFGMAGLRVGWIACQDKEILNHLTHTKHYTSICNSAPSEILSLITLRNKTTFLKRNNDIVAHNLGLLDAFFARHADRFSWVRPQGGCTGLVRYNGTEGVDAFAAQLVEKTGILLLPSSMYDAGNKHFRIGFGRSNMPEILTMFEEFVNQY